MASETVNSTPPLRLVREGARLYTASNGQVTIRVGDKRLHSDVFNPGELLKLALAGCAALSADSTLAHRLGDDVAISADVESTFDDTRNAFSAIAVRIVASMSELDPEQREDLLARVNRAIDRYCTVAHTVVDGPLDYRLEVVGDDE